MINDKRLCSSEGVQFANINHLKIILHKSHNLCTMTNREVEVDDSEPIRESVHQLEQSWRKRVKCNKVYYKAKNEGYAFEIP